MPRRAEEKPNAGGFYDDPAWYDILHTPGTAGEVRGLEMMHERFAPRARTRRWLEPACGTGRYLRVAAARGVRTTGVDLSARMLGYARASFERRGLPGDFIEAGMESFTARTEHHLAFCLINSVRHLMTDRAMLAHLACVFDALHARGVYVLGVSLSDPGYEMPSEDVWKARRGLCEVHQLVNYLPAEGVRGERGRRELVISHLRVTTPTRVRTVDHTYALRTYTPRQWASLLKRAGLTIRAIVDERGDDLPIPAGATDGFDLESLAGRYALYVLARRG
ncbi:MAG: class I SAM-dependent methyltransferase [Planctomycetota bacterium]